MANQETGTKGSVATAGDTAKPKSLAALMADKAKNPNAAPISREQLESIDTQKFDALAAGHTVPGTPPVVKPLDAAVASTLPIHGIEKPGTLPQDNILTQPVPSPAITDSFPHSPDNPPAAKPISTTPYAGDPPAKPLDMAGIVEMNDAVQPVSSNNNSEANDIKYVPASVEAPKGSYVALRLHSLIRRSGAKVVPTNGYYIVEDPEVKELLEYYAGLNTGLVELVK